MKLSIKRLDPGIDLPVQANRGDAGLDLRSTLDLTIKPGERAVVPAGIAVAIPEGYAGFVQPRSGLAARHGLGIVNSPGLIDAGYRGEIKVVLVNLDPSEAVEISRGDRIAQLVVLPVPQVQVIEVDELPGSERGESGFGSSGR
ncbi:MAG TPA: dUTP diphosphatase [Actinomycetota bacterium]|nr:dUTP diphosphatase [Actinomycetota bacterium]